MLRRLGAKLARQGITAKVIEAGAEKLPFPDASFDTVVITLALCSVRDLSRSLAEVKRVLKPDGELRFIEHVRSDARGWACFQKVIKPIHTRLGDGCQPDRATVEAIGDEGFEIVELQRFKLGPYPTRPFVMGVARKPAELVRASH
jgi:ubiquinone/menaquinone biosynthesis C-methylase UbiE